MSLLPALLAGCAVATMSARPSARRRLPAGRDEPSGRDPSSTLSPAVVRAVSLLAGFAIWAVAGGVVGLGAGILVAVLGPRAVARLDNSPDATAEVMKDLPLALDLLAACLAGGAVPGPAVTAVAAALPGPCGARFGQVAARLAVGTAPAEAWRSLGEDRGAAGAAARAMARAAQGGAPVAAAVQRVAEDARRESGARAERAARRAGVLAVGPLGLCFLPAFLLIGVVPAVVGLAAPLLRSL